MNKLSGNFVKSNSFNLKANRFKQKFNITIQQSFIPSCKSLSSGLDFTQSMKSVLQSSSQFDKFQYLEEVGQGMHSIVKKIQYPDNSIYAAKIQQRFIDEESLLLIKQEYNILKILDHPNIIKAKDFIYNSYEDHWALILEYFNGRTLMEESNFSSQNKNEIKYIMKQLLESVKYLQDQFICHRDISITNILINREKECIKLIDFECAKKYKQENLCTPQNSWFSAPEQAKGGIYNEKVDMWSIGHVFFYLLTKKQISKSKLLNYLKIYNFSYRLLSIVKKSSLEKYIEDTVCLDLLQNLLIIDPEGRYTPQLALLHPMLL